MARSLSVIANEVIADKKAGNWSSKSWQPAKPHIAAMTQLQTLNDKYFEDSARSIVSYFLANAGTWRGETARRVKAELKEMLKQD